MATKRKAKKAAAKAPAKTKAKPKPKRSRKWFTPAQRAAIVARVDKLIAGGMARGKAYAKVGVAGSNYLNWTKERAPARQGAPRKEGGLRITEKGKALLRTLGAPLTWTTEAPEIPREMSIAGLPYFVEFPGFPILTCALRSTDMGALQYRLFDRNLRTAHAAWDPVPYMSGIRFAGPIPYPVEPK